MRHFPIEELYDDCLRVVPETDAYSDLGAWVIATDGSSRNGHGGFSVVLQAPHQQSCVIRRGYIGPPCTNTKAEPKALQVAFEMIRTLLPRTPFGTTFHVLTDSQFCLQLLHGVYGTSANLLEVAGLMAAWAPVAEYVELIHVKSHAGQYHNELADTHAKLAMFSCRPEVLTFLQAEPHVDIGSEGSLLRKLRHPLVPLT